MGKLIVGLLDIGLQDRQEHKKAALLAARNVYVLILIKGSASHHRKYRNGILP